MKRGVRWTVLAIAGLVAAVVAVRLLNPLPSLEGRISSRAVAPEGSGLVGAAIRQQITARQGQSGLRLLQMAGRLSQPGCCWRAGRSAASMRNIRSGTMT